DSQISRSLMKQFHAAIKQSFTGVGSDYVGPQALALLKAGKHLTSAVGLSSEWDLVLRNPSQPMVSERVRRIPYEDSYKTVRRLYPGTKFGSAVLPPRLNRRPHVDDEEPLGIRFFRTVVNEHSLDNLTLPHTFFCRSAVGPISFKNTDLHESTLCWN